MAGAHDQDDQDGRLRFRGAVLTGGASRRMGRDKAMIEVDGRAMAATVAAALSAVGCEPVVAVGGDRDRLARLGLAYVADVAPGTGPFGGVVAALERFTADGCDGDWVIVAACDLAMLTAGVLEPLIEQAGRLTADDASGVDVVVARTDRLEPALAIWRLAAHERVRGLFDEGERAMHRAIGRLRSIEVAVDAHALRNMNTPADLAQRF